MCDLPPRLPFPLQQRWVRAKPGWACGHRQLASIIDTAEPRAGTMDACRADAGGCVIPVTHTEACHLEKWTCFSGTTGMENAIPCSQGRLREVQTLIRFLCRSSPAPRRPAQCGTLLGLLARLLTLHAAACRHTLTSGQQQDALQWVSSRPPPFSPSGTFGCHSLMPIKPFCSICAWSLSDGTAAW